MFVLRLVIVVALSLTSVSTWTRAADSSAARLPPAQPEPLKERDRLRTEAQKLRDANQVAEAIALYEAVLKLETGVYGEEHASLLPTLQQLAELHEQRNDFLQAVVRRDQALNLATKRYGPSDWRTADALWARRTTDLLTRGGLDQRQKFQRAESLNKEVFSLVRQGISERSLLLAWESLQLRREVLGPDHPTVALTLHNLAAQEQSGGRWGSAWPHYQQSLAIYQHLYQAEHYPRGHPFLALNLHSLGGLLKQMARYREALSTFEQALGMRQRLYPSTEYPQGHPELAASLFAVGEILEAGGNYAGALSYYEQALAMNRKLYPVEPYRLRHPELANCLNSLGHLHYVLGTHGKALEHAEQAVAMYERLYPSDALPQGHPRRAASLNNLGLIWKAIGDFDKAFGNYDKALAMRRELYPRARFPRGHPDLSTSLHNQGLLLSAMGEYGQALAYLEQALTMQQQLSPIERFPQGHPFLAAHHNALGLVLKEMGAYRQAVDHLEQALAMLQRLYPAARYPQGHPHLVSTLNNLGFLAEAMGEYGKALRYHQQALTQCRLMYPAARHPDGHPTWATCLDNIGSVLKALEEYEGALGYHSQALAMRQKLFPTDRYPHGHPELVNTLNALGNLYLTMGTHDKALRYHEQARAMNEQIYPVARFREGHARLASSLNAVGTVLSVLGDYDKAETCLKQAWTMRQRLFPVPRYPQGHPHLVVSLNNLGWLCQRRGEFDRAAGYYEQALAMQRRLNVAFAERATQAELLAYRAQAPLLRDAYLSVTRSRPVAEVYGNLWAGRALASQILECRHLAARAALDQPEVRQPWKELEQVRQQLGPLLQCPERTRKQESQLQSLSERKEQLERLLNAQVPALAEHQELDRLGPQDLQQRLPADAVFVDLIRYVHFERDAQSKGRGRLKETPSYVAFLVCPKRPVERIELGPAALIDHLVVAWRQEIQENTDNGSAAELRRLVWEPLARHLDERVEVIYLAPDGPLGRLPWVALPGKQPGTILLEEHALAVVPHGRHLLSNLARRPRSHDRQNSILAVGNPAYDAFPDGRLTASKRVEEADASKAPGRESADLQVHWKPLPATQREVEVLQQLAGPRVRVLTGTDASLHGVAALLPKVRIAHLATHGFFNEGFLREARRREREQLRNLDFGLDGEEGLGGAATRNPLAYGGLVWAGANQHRDDLLAILTGEAIVQLLLDDLDLSVLSACETGLGDEVNGECVASLQRAFHVAGCRNVIGSLWKVPDEATAALMNVFYDDLLSKQKSPLEALRTAQLTLYRHPERIPALARGERGAPVVTTKPVETTTPRPPGPRAPVRSWAAFVLSGLGR